jgi:hypothetical protein
MAEKRNAFRLLLRKEEGKRPPGKQRSRWEYNIKMKLLEMRWVVWIGFVWLRIGTSGGLL